LDLHQDLFVRCLFAIRSLVTKVNFTVAIYARIATVNDILSNILENPKQRNRNLIKVTKAHHHDEKEIICTISEVYQDLLCISDSVNKIFGFTLMLGFATIWSFTIFTLFSIYKNIIAYGSLTRKTAVAIGFAVYYNSFLITTVYNAFKTRSEAANLIRNVNEMIKRSKDRSKISMLITLQNQISKRMPNFTCGLFDFDWKLIFMVREVWKQSSSPNN